MDVPESKGSAEWFRDEINREMEHVSRELPAGISWVGAKLLDPKARYDRGLRGDMIVVSWAARTDPCPWGPDAMCDRMEVHRYLTLKDYAEDKVFRDVRYFCEWLQENAVWDMYEHARRHGVRILSGDEGEC